MEATQRISVTLDDPSRLAWALPGGIKPDIARAIELHYKPANPDHLLDFNWWQRLLFSGVFIGFGGLALAVAMGWVR